jgi:hypothetical protein
MCLEENSQIKPVTRSEYADIISVLESQAIITLQKAKDERSRKLGLNIAHSDVEMGLKQVHVVAEALDRIK